VGREGKGREEMEGMDRIWLLDVILDIMPLAISAAAMQNTDRCTLATACVIMSQMQMTRSRETR